MQSLAINKIPFVMTFTKVDKLSESAISRNIEVYKNEMLKEWGELPKIFITSAEKKRGLEDILSFIDSLNKKYI